MSECTKCQKVVKKNKTIYRCINKKSSKYGHKVTEEDCAACSVPSYRSKGCSKKPTTNKEVKKEIKIEKEVEKEIEKEYPSLSTQMVAYKDALIRWHKAGKPIRSDPEVNNIVEKCKKCDWYDSEKKRCRGCGCKVTNGGIAILNKAKMATEHCPKGLW